MVELAAAYQQALTGTAGLELVPPRWLHLTVHGVGLLEEISIRQVRSIADAVARELSLVGAQPATFDRWSVNHGVICLMPASTAVFNDVRGAVRAGMAEVLGATGLAEPVDGFEPHVSIAFVTADQPAAPVVERLSAVTASPATHVVRSADLLEMYRGADAYQWRRIATAELGFPALGEQ
ncbi:MAG TPA: 2'-5' RNA ligase family protein [Kribbella sp.]|nr:2'-5' RNA ligase family protein [Kribbella sp.]